MIVTTASRQNKTKIADTLQYRFDPNTGGVHLYLVPEGKLEKTLYIEPERLLGFVVKIIAAALAHVEGKTVVREGDALNRLVIWHNSLETFNVILMDVNNEVLVEVTLSRLAVMYFGMRLLQDMYNRNYLGNINVSVEL